MNEENGIEAILEKLKRLSLAFNLYVIKCIIHEPTVEKQETKIPAENWVVK